jgi:hypothetical protein
MAKRVRAVASGWTFADSRRAVLVWEPKRVVPSYAFALSDLRATPTPSDDAPAAENPVQLAEGARRSSTRGPRSPCTPARAGRRPWPWTA